MRCRLCEREVRSEDETLCKYHRLARDNLKECYNAWNDAYSGITWAEYLNRVKTLEDTGQWIRDVISLEEVQH